MHKLIFKPNTVLLPENEAYQLTFNWRWTTICKGLLCN